MIHMKRLTHTMTLSIVLSALTLGSLSAQADVTTTGIGRNSSITTPLGQSSSQTQDAQNNALDELSLRRVLLRHQQIWNGFRARGFGRFNEETQKYVNRMINQISVPNLNAKMPLEYVQSVLNANAIELSLALQSEIANAERNGQTAVIAGANLAYLEQTMFSITTEKVETPVAGQKKPAVSHGFL